MPTTYTHLISAQQLLDLYASGTPVRVFDCSSDLLDPKLADQQFAQERIAGATQAHIDRDLSAHDPAQAACGGRHPLPRREVLAQTFSRLGLDNTVQAVAYDRSGGGYCGRLWWLLKWAGHDKVAVLDGGLQAWKAAGGALDSGLAPAPAPADFRLGPELRHWVNTEHVAQHLGQASQTLLDARAAPRYRGEVEPMDPVAGHIPGALNRPFDQNFGPDGRYKNPEQLRAEFDTLLAGCDPSGLILHCGSGVTAIPNLIALELAGYGPRPLYAGSWSEWCRTPGLPVERSTPQTPD